LNSCLGWFEDWTLSHTIPEQLVVTRNAMTVAYTDILVHPASGPFYTMFPWEPVRMQAEIKVDRIVEVTGLRMEWLLDQIPSAVGQAGNVVIIYHGTDMGLSMPLAIGTQVHADSEMMAVLDSSRSDTDVAQMCQFPNPRTTGAQRVHTLREKMRRVKDLRLNSVELRACNTGQSMEHMQTIKRFFNCRTLGAPKLRDSYFFLDPGTATSHAQTWENWQHSHPRHRLFDVPGDGRVGIAIRETAHSAFQTFMLVNKDSAPSFWADSYLARLHPHTVGMRRFAGHALYDTLANFPPIFPGEDAYTQHIVHV
jgi:hypothetical protein